MVEQKTHNWQELSSPPEDEEDVEKLEDFEEEEVAVFDYCAYMCIYVVFFNDLAFFLTIVAKFRKKSTTFRKKSTKFRNKSTKNR